jgi:hypothetical protein
MKILPKWIPRLLSLCPALLLVAGCAQTPITSNVQTGSVKADLEPGAKRSTPVVPGRPARMYVMVGFSKDCRPMDPGVRVERAPTKGTITFKTGQTTFIQQSSSGNCVGQSLPGTGIYYTAQPGATGEDSFSVVAASAAGGNVSRSFRVQIQE